MWGLFCSSVPNMEASGLSYGRKVFGVREEKEKKKNREGYQREMW